MSTSPSWFDQDKFHRLVTKVGAKTAAGSPASAATATRQAKRSKASRTTGSGPLPSDVLGPSVKASQPIQRTKNASLPGVSATESPDPSTTTSNLPSPSSMGEESLPGFPLPVAAPASRPGTTLSRRTAPLPDLKSLFEYDKPNAASGPTAESETADPETESIGPQQIDSKTEMPDPISDLPATEAAETTPARPGEIELLRSQVAELDEARKERDDSRRESDLLRAQLAHQDAGQETTPPASHADELARAIEERDQSRRDYALLREQFETLKHDQLRSRGEPAQKNSELQHEIEMLRAQLAEHEEEFNSLKLGSIGHDPELDSLREEADMLQTQLNKAREEASIAQRGLALSQKALQETRDALREASEGTSQTKASFDSLKNECATLVQQNMLLQAQHDQLSRELATLKAKKTSRTADPSI